jgi:dTDP-L-rhamnose 4-epimerase
MGRYRTGDVRHCVGDPSAAEALLGWKARVDLEEGLAELLQWSDNQLARDAVEASVVELEQNGLLT